MGKSPREAVFRKKVWDFLKVLPNSHFCAIQQTALRGTPDYLGCVRGRFVALELKRHATAPRSPMQVYNIGKFKDLGGFAEFVFPENWESIKGYLIEMAGLDPNQL